MNDFLPTHYDLPKSETNYLEFEDGSNRFRVLSSCTVGWLWWEDEQGNPLSHPTKGCSVRYVKSLDAIPKSVQVRSDLRPRHFWAFCCWNYQLDQVQVAKLTQLGLMRGMERYVKHPDWGSPLDYDFIVHKSGEGLNTKYQLLVAPKQQTDEGILAMYREMNIDLEAFYRGEDPFGRDENRQAQLQSPKGNGLARPPVQANGAYIAR